VKILRRLLAIASLGLVASCTQGTNAGGPESSSLDSTVAWLTKAINDSSSIRVEMGDKLITHSTVVVRREVCVLAIRDKRHTQLGSSWEEADVKATVDLRRVSPAIGTKPFTGSGYHGAVLTVSAPKETGAIRQDMELSSSAIGLSHTAGAADSFEFTISDDAVAERIRRALAHAVELCRG